MLETLLVLEYNLQQYKCPQLFIQFKLGLREALTSQQGIVFQLPTDQSTHDIERYLKKYYFQYQLKQQHHLLTVEPKRV